MLAFNYNKYVNNFNTIFSKTKKKTKPKAITFLKNKKNKFVKIKYNKRYDKYVYKYKTPFLVFKKKNYLFFQ